MIGNVFITGVSSGIGLALAREYLAKGFHVYGVSRRQPAELIEHPNFQFDSIDLSRGDESVAAVKHLARKAENFDLVILNAGVLGRVADIGEISAEELRGVLEVNLVANKLLLDGIFALGIPIQQVVAISSGAAASPHRGWNAYAISKTALNMMIGLYALERPETHFCALAPGIIDTPMQDQISDVTPDKRFPSLEMLRMAKGSPVMPKPELAASRLLEGIAKATKYPTGSFLDIRSLVKNSWPS